LQEKREKREACLGRIFVNGKLMDEVMALKKKHCSCEDLPYQNICRLLTSF
jgi:hypothetical protein